MKLLIDKPQEIEAVAIRVSVPVRYDEEDIPNDFPLRKNDVWTGTIDLDTGKIREWPQGHTGSMHMKVTDCGTYTLLGKDDAVIAEIENDYVPCCIPGEYGDYVEFDINENGVIAEFTREATPTQVLEAFFV